MESKVIKVIDMMLRVSFDRVGNGVCVKRVEKRHLFGWRNMDKSVWLGTTLGDTIRREVLK